MRDNSISLSDFNSTQDEEQILMNMLKKGRRFCVLNKKYIHLQKNSHKLLNHQK
jgi:hypothetical protein